MASLRCIALNCTLKTAGASNTEVLMRQVLKELDQFGVDSDLLRVAAYDLHPGVLSDPQGPGDEWPTLRERILSSDILILGTPIWLGNPSSICKRVMERMDGLLSETDDKGRMIAMDKVAGAVVTGNEDGAHNAIAQIYQGLSDIGFTIPTNAATYWVGEAMSSVDYGDLDAPPGPVAATTTLMSSNLAHLARLLREHPYPPTG